MMILKDTTTFQVLFIVSLFSAWNITTVEINSGVYLLKSEFRQVPLFTSGGLGLVILISVLVCKQWSWSWSCYFGLGLGRSLKNFVLFTSLYRSAHPVNTTDFAL